MSKTGHWPIAPSSAARVVQCPGSLTMEARYPELEDSEHALEGTAAHWVLQEMIEGEAPGVGAIAPNGRTVTQEMIEGAQVACEQIEQDLAPFGMGLKDVAVEVSVTIKRVHDQCGGTPDVRAWVPANRHPQAVLTLYVWDYKFGFRPVEAFENYQCIAYAVGALEQTQVSDLAAQVVLSIIQPRAFHRDGPCRWWKTSFSNLRPYVNQYSNAAHAALGGNPKCNTGPECRDCRARHACAALQKSGYTAVEASTDAQPLELDAAALGLELRIVTDAIERLNARATGLQEQAISQLSKGARIPGWVIAHGRGSKVWARGVAEVTAMAAMVGVKVVKPPELVTPRQAEKAGLPPALVSAFSTQLSGEAKLTRDDGSMARQIFQQ